MSFGCNFHNRNNFGFFGGFNSFGSPRFANQNFFGHICNFIGETVTVFTTSGGASGCGFTGILLSVNCDFIRICTQIGTAPSVPLNEEICSDFTGFDFGNASDSANGTTGCSGNCNNRCGHERNRRSDRNRDIGSVVDIPLSMIAAFCHNAV